MLYWRFWEHAIRDERDFAAHLLHIRRNTLSLLRPTVLDSLYSPGQPLIDCA